MNASILVKIQNPFRASVLVACCMFLLSCGGSGGDSNGEVNNTGGPSSGDDVQDTLSNLNVDTEDTPRANADGQALPADYTPLGPRRTLLQKSELFIAGPERTSDTDTVNLLKPVVNTNGNLDPMISLAPNLDTQWVQADVHTATSGDVDGDGFDEMVVAWHDSTTMAIRLKIFQDTAENYIESSESTLLTADPDWMALVTGDFNGDGFDQIGIAVVDDADGADPSGTVEFYLLEGSASTSYVVSANGRLSWAATQANSELGIELAAGRLDRDSGEELAVVINETFGQGRNQAPGDGISTYYVYDDASANFAEVASDRIAAIVDNQSYLGVVGTVALGDVDGDGLDELVIAALDRFSSTCEDITSIQLAVDDLDADLTELDAIIGIADISGCEVGGNNGHTEHLWAGVLNMDGDEAAEIHVNGVVFDDFVTSNGSWVQIAEIPTRDIFRGSGNNDRAQTRRDNTMMVTGDVTSDGREDIIVYSPKSVAVGTGMNGNITFDINDSAISVWGIATDSVEFEKLHFELLDGFAADQPGSPVILTTLNVDNDSTVIQAISNSHELVFSEPILHAALAAPPCWDTGVQATEQCITAWGRGQTAGANASVSHTISGSYHTGVNGTVSLPIVGDVGVEVEQTVGASLTAEASLGYELTRTLTYTTGAMEDTVIATVMPYDQYTYRILAHPVYPDLVGEEMVVSLPRRPRTIQIERQFYNDSIIGEGVIVDDSVFSHTIGNPRSYPGGAISGFGALSFGPFDVGISTGSQTVEISESVVAGVSASVSVSYETTVKATSGAVMRGFSVGQETTATLGVSVGSSVSFAGTVGDFLPAASNDDGLEYSFGISVYQQSASSQDRPFQVINYWVE